MERSKVGVKLPVCGIPEAVEIGVEVGLSVGVAEAVGVGLTVGVGVGEGDVDAEGVETKAGPSAA